VLQLSLLLECRITQISQRVVAEVLIVLSVKEPGENWQVTLFMISFRQTSPAITSTSFDQGETYNGNVFELPMTWVTKCPEKGILTLTYSRFEVLTTFALF
jgi:hypothetical protein